MPYVAIVYVNDPAIAKAIMESGNNDWGQIVGLYRFPSSKNVECPGWRCPHVENKRYGYGRHPEHAYIVHGGCGRREKGFRQRLHKYLLDTFGINLLPRDRTPRIFQNPEGYDLL